MRFPVFASPPSAGTELYRPAARTSTREYHHYQQRRMSFCGTKALPNNFMYSAGTVQEQSSWPRFVCKAFQFRRSVSRLTSADRGHANL
jgi:hypothetical protein